MNLTFTKPVGPVGRHSGFFKRYHSIIFVMRVSVFYLVLLTCSMQMLLASSGNGQSIEEIKVTLGMRRGETLESLFKNIEKQSGLLFAFNYEKVNKYSNIRLAKATRTIKETLDIVLQETPFIYRQVKNSVVIFQEGEEPDWEKETFLFNESKETESPLRITGKVIDTEGTPMAGVNIIVKGTTRGTSTDADGKFAIDAEDNEVLVFSFIGFKTFETQVNARVVIDVTLEDEVESLQEVVVNAGYWNVKEREKTGSISKVTSEVISKQPVTNPLGALHGRMPGVFVQQTTGVPGGDFKIQIRGLNSLRRSGDTPIGNDPLYIVDGVPFSTEKVSSHSAAGGLIVGGVNPLTSINSADIESIEILKDADATAIYGSRGANGVVLITTKKGKAGRTKIDINYYSGFGKARLQKLLNTKQYLAVRREAFANDNITPTADPGDNQGLNGKGYAPDLMVWDTTRYTDWQKVFLGNTARTTSIQTSVSGGNEKTQFLLSAGYYSETSVFPGEFKFRKLSSHLSLNHTSENNKFFANVSISGSLDKHDQPRTDYSLFSRGLAPNAPNLYNEDGTLNWEYHPETGQTTWVNPMAGLELTYQGDVNNLITNTIIGYEIVAGLKIQSRIGYNRIASEELTLYPSTRYDPKLGYGSEQSSATTSNGRTNSWIIEPQLSWEEEIAEGQLSFLVGGTYQEQDHKRLANGYFNFPSNVLIRDLSAAANRYVYEYTASIYKYAAIFGRVNYNWHGKYIMNLTGRRDGSSRFGPARQFANFGAMGAAWIFSEESFSKNNLAFLSFGKLRGSFGITGSDQIGNYQFLDTYETPENINSYDGVTVLDPTRLYNPVFGWESNKKMEGALELGFLDDRISLTLGYYLNRSSNQLVNYTLPTTTGFSGVQANLDATVQNTGTEVEMTTVNIKSNEFEWTTSLNFTVPGNKLIKFPNLDSSTYSNIYIIGESIYIQKFFEYTGIDPETGLYTVRDYNNDVIISRDVDSRKAMFVGQNFFGGINNTIIYKGWTLDIFLHVVKQTGIVQTFPYGYLNLNFPAEVLDQDRWRNPGDHADIQRFATEYTQGIGTASYGSPHYNYYYSDASVTDASFIRLKTVSLSYQFPQKWMKGIRNCMAYIRGQNLGVITNYKGSDPETQSRSNLPPLRTITVGVNLTF